MTDSKTISAYDSQVESYLNLINEQAEDQQLIDFISKFNPNDYILDLGCGPAISSMIMREHGLRVDPTDASKEMVNLANTKFDIGARQAVFEDINTKDTYDGVWANFSLLHATPEELPNILLAINQALKNKGVFHLGMKTGQGSKRDKFNRLYSYYSQEDLTAHLEKAGFLVENIELGEAVGLAGDMEPWIALTCIA